MQPLISSNTFTIAKRGFVPIQSAWSKRPADLVEVDEERLTLWTLARAAADPRPFWDNLM
jgi:hypothetical protein